MCGNVTQQTMARAMNKGSANARFWTQAGLLSKREVVLKGGRELKTDRRVQRTRRSLREALIALILERGWERTTVQDVCDRADVGRSTFYLHFQSKEKLLTSGFDDLRIALRSTASAPTNASDEMFPFVEGLVQHVDENRRLFRAIVGKRSGNIVQVQFRLMVVDFISEDLSRLALPKAQHDATVPYVAGALVELLIWWVEGRSPLSPRELAALFQRLTNGVLATQEVRPKLPATVATHLK